MVDKLQLHILNRTMKPFAIVLSGTEGLGGGGGGDLTTV
jgi:hypothetical protein